MGIVRGMALRAGVPVAAGGAAFAFMPSDGSNDRLVNGAAVATAASVALGLYHVPQVARSAARLHSAQRALPQAKHGVHEAGAAARGKAPVGAPDEVISLFETPVALRWSAPKVTPPVADARAELRAATSDHRRQKAYMRESLALLAASWGGSVAAAGKASKDSA